VVADPEALAHRIVGDLEGRRQALGWANPP